MRMRLATTFALLFSLATGAIARADDKDSKQSKRGAQPTQTVRGTISGVALEGELVIDYKTNRAIEADMTMLTIVGSPVRGQAVEGGVRERLRPNVYIVWLEQGTKVRDSSGGALADKASQAEPWNALEIGDLVEVEYTPRDLTTPAAQQNQRKHGRHRMYFGDAKSLKILSVPPHQEETRKRRPDAK